MATVTCRTRALVPSGTGEQVFVLAKELEPCAPRLIIFQKKCVPATCGRLLQCAYAILAPAFLEMRPLNPMQSKSNLALLTALFLLAPIAIAQTEGGSAQHGDRPGVGGDALGDRPEKSSGHSEQGGGQPPHGYGEARRNKSLTQRRVHP